MRWELPLTALGLLLLVVGHGIGLFVAPPEAMMGDVGRILYAHVPTAWVALVAYLAAFVAAVGSLWSGRFTWDAAVAATVEVGVVLNGLLLAQGSIWARPTWGVYWTWDPRLTTTAVMFVMFVGVLLLRSLVEVAERRLTVTAVAGIVAFANVPVVYFSVKWWRTLHQDFSSPETVSSPMVTPLRIAAFGMLFVAIGIAVMRWRSIYAAVQRETESPALPDMPAPLKLPEVP